MIILATKTLPYRTLYTEHIRFNSNPGTGGIEDEYDYEVDSKGRKKLVKVGEKDLYKEIQSYAESCKIENILKRAASGDMSDFRPDGIYADTTAIPTNLNDAQKEMMKLQRYWNSQPIEIKNKYNNSVDEFIAAVGSKAWMTDMGYIKEAPEAPVPDAAGIAPELNPEKPTE